MLQCALGADSGGQHVRPARGIGFLMFKREAVDWEGRMLPGVVLMRGGCVAILPVLICNSVKVGYRHDTVQPRLAHRAS